jgi:hypothetical protein
VISTTITLSSLILTAVSLLLHIFVFKKKRICTVDLPYFIFSLLQFKLSIV